MKQLSVGDQERLAIFEAFLDLPTDPTLPATFGHKITAPSHITASDRIRLYAAHSVAYLMQRDLERDGDL
jgi:hypothetical protein